MARTAGRAHDGGFATKPTRGTNSLGALPDAGLPQKLQLLEGTFDGLLSRLAAAFETQRHFFANAAHELAHAEPGAAITLDAPSPVRACRATRRPRAAPSATCRTTR